MTRVLTCNMQANQRRWRYVSDARKLRRLDPDVANLQEIGGAFKARAIRVAFGPRFKMVRLSGPASAVPILFNRREYELVHARRWHLSDETFVGKAGAGPATLREKEATWVTLRHRKTGRIENFANCHLAPSLYIDVREELHVKQIERLVQLAIEMEKRYPGSSRYISGDFNTKAGERTRPLNEVGMRAGRNLETHRHGPLDHIFSDESGKRRVVRGFYTDHDALVGNF